MKAGARASAGITPDHAEKMPLAKLLLASLAIAALSIVAARPQAPHLQGEFLATKGEAGRYGGKLVVAMRSEPKTLNPVTAVDGPSRDVIRRMMADLISVNRQSHLTEPGLAKSWTVSPDGRRYTLQLRRGLRFSDGLPFDAGDVLFTFQVHLDEKVHSPQRDLLIVGGKPLAVQQIDSHTVRFELAEPYAAAERLFDGVAILPRHLLQKAHQEGKLAAAWDLTTPPQRIAGLGPFRLKEYVPGERLVLERNPHYWKVDRAGNRLPYLDEIFFLFVGSEDVQAIRFLAGETDVISRLSAKNFSVLAKEQRARGYRLDDLGPGLEYNFLFFNLNDLDPKGPAQIARKQAWFRQVSFRQAISAAIDREGIVRLVYRGRATPLWAHVTPANRLWINRAIPQPGRSLARARELLASGGFSWKSDGTLVDRTGETVGFSIVTNAGNAERVQMATIIQDDLKQLGMQVHLVSLEFRALLDRLMNTRDYEAAVLALGSVDVDPTAEMNVWLRGGSTHLWNLGQRNPAAAWEAEIDRLMRQQLTELNYAERKRLYDRVQQLVAENLPLVCLVSPNILVGAKKGLGNFRPAILDHYTLWNIEELFWTNR